MLCLLYYYRRWRIAIAGRIKHSIYRAVIQRAKGNFRHLEAAMILLNLGVVNSNENYDDNEYYFG